MINLLSNFWDYLVPAGVLIVAIGLFILSYLLNKKTPKPEGCQDTTQECEGCKMIGCSHHPINQEQNKGEEDHV